jgi:MATE family multidrug resistance protein
MKLGLALACIVALLFLALPEILLGIFSDDAEVLALGRPLLVLGAVFQLVDAVGIIASGALRGAGDTRWPFLVQTTLAWGVRLPLAYLFGIALGGGLLGAWAGELCYLLALAGVFVARFRSGAWRRLRI